MGAPKGNDNAKGPHKGGGSSKKKSPFLVSKGAGKQLMKSGSAAKAKENQKFWAKAIKKQKK